jgi:hypothetical protein
MTPQAARAVPTSARSTALPPYQASNPSTPPATPSNPPNGNHQHTARLTRPKTTAAEAQCSEGDVSNSGTISVTQTTGRHGRRLCRLHISDHSRRVTRSGTARLPCGHALSAAARTRRLSHNPLRTIENRAAPIGTANHKRTDASQVKKQNHKSNSAPRAGRARALRLHDPCETRERLTEVSDE